MRCFDEFHMTDEGRQAETIRCADTSDAPTDRWLTAIGWGIVHRAHMDTAIKDSSGGRFPGTTLAAAMVPMPQ